MFNWQKNKIQSINSIKQEKNVHCLHKSQFPRPWPAPLLNEFVANATHESVPHLYMDESWLNEYIKYHLFFRAWQGNDGAVRSLEWTFGGFRLENFIMMEDGYMTDSGIDKFSYIQVTWLKFEAYPTTVTACEVPLKTMVLTMWFILWSTFHEINSFHEFFLVWKKKI
jgi:hypothetical protein